MTTGSTDSQAFVAALARDATAAAGEHPEVERLLDYQSGILGAGAEASVQAHLVGCRRCARTLLDLEPFRETPEPGEGVAELATVAAWRDFKKRIDEPRPLAGGRRPRGFFGFRPAAPGHSRWGQYAAAALLVCVLGLSFRVVQLRQTHDHLRHTTVGLSGSLSEPRFDVKEMRRGGRSQNVDIRLLPDQHLFHLDFGSLPRAYPAYEVKILDMAGEPILRLLEHELSSAGELDVPLLRRYFSDGDYQVQVWGLDGDRRVSLRDRVLRMSFRERESEE